MTFNTKIGKFVFNERITLANAKLVRDTTVAQFLLRTDGVRLKDAHDCMAYASDTLRGLDGHLLESVTLW